MDEYSGRAAACWPTAGLLGPEIAKPPRDNRALTRPLGALEISF